jgi:hypothetical protein
MPKEYDNHSANGSMMPHGTSGNRTPADANSARWSDTDRRPTTPDDEAFSNAELNGQVSAGLTFNQVSSKLKVKAGHREVKTQFVLAGSDRWSIG